MPRRPLTRVGVSSSTLLRGCLGWWRSSPANLGLLRVPSLVGLETLFDATTGNLATFSRGANVGCHPGGYSAWPCSSSGSLYQYCGTTLASAVQDHTVAAWVYLNDTTSGQMLCSRATNITGAGYEWGLMPQFRFAYFGSGVNGFYNGPTLSAATWVHVVGTWEQAAGSVKFYVNGGAPTTVGTSTQTITHTGLDPFLWGNQVQNAILSGYLDDMAVWDRALTAGEATAWYRSSSQGHAGLLDLTDRGALEAVAAVALMRRRQKGPAPREPRPLEVW